MNHWEMENAVHLGVALKESGFQVSRVCCSRPSCFDFAAGKNDKTILVKVSSDVDTFSANNSRELKVIAGHVSATPLIVSQQTHGKPLEDDTVYSRNSVFVVTEKTIKNIAVQTANPLVYAGPGGYSVEIDGELVEKRRKELGLSIGQLANMVGVSRRTLYGYEKGMAKASVKSAYKLAETLGIPVAKPIKIIEKTPTHRQCLLIRARYASSFRLLLQKIFRKFANCDVTAIHMAPFDFVMKSAETKNVILGCVAPKSEEDLETRMEEVLSVCRVVNARPVLITEDRNSRRIDVPTYCIDELSEMCRSEDLMAVV